MQEKLTHVNTHAKLSIDITFKAIKAVENIIRKDGTANGIQHAMDKTIQFYHKKLDREQNMQNSSSNNGTMAFGSNQHGIPGNQDISKKIPQHFYLITFLYIYIYIYI